MRHRFDINDNVYHIAKDQYGKVLHYWNDGKQARYIIRHSEVDWSVPENGLRRDKAIVVPAGVFKSRL